MLFSTELFACNTAFVVIAADCLTALGSKTSPLIIKALFVGLLTPFTITGNMKIFSYSSLVGIIAVTGTSLIVIGSGATPGPPSWINPASSVRWLPRDFEGLAASVGIIFVGFDAHSVFPAILNSMSERTGFSKAVNYSYYFAFLLYGSIAVLGYLMFGSDIQVLCDRSNYISVKSLRIYQSPIFSYNDPRFSQISS
jgi:vesicular inhibitory amino acid transporter